jgi:hypothetical protein
MSQNSALGAGLSRRGSQPCFCPPVQASQVPPNVVRTIDVVRRLGATASGSASHPCDTEPTSQRIPMMTVAAIYRPSPFLISSRTDPRVPFAGLSASCP